MMTFRVIASRASDGKMHARLEVERIFTSRGLAPVAAAEDAGNRIDWEVCGVASVTYDEWLLLRAKLMSAGIEVRDDAALQTAPAAQA